MRNVRQFVAGTVSLMGIVLGVLSPCVAGIGEWKTYTTKREVRSVVFDERHGTVWAATSGGLFSYHFSDSTFGEFTTSEGLRTIDLTAIAIDSSGTIWSGGSNGFIHAYSPVTKQWKYIADIVTLNATNKRINALTVTGDTLFVLSDFGVSVFSIPQMEFGGTYSRFGATTTQLVGTATSVQLFDNNLWVSTRSGIASTPISNMNPSAPESWQVYTSAQGLLSDSVVGLAVLHDTLYAGTASGLAYFDGVRWDTVPGTRGMNILGLVLHLDRIGFFTQNQFGKLYSTMSMVVLPAIPFTLTAVGYGSIPVLGTSSRGVLIQNGSSWIPIVPPGPPTNRFFGMAVDEQGVLWSGTGVASTDGFVRFDGHTWRSYSPATDTILGTAKTGGGSAFQVNIGANGIKWVSLFGNGAALIGNNDTIQRVFNTTNGLSYTTNQFDSTHFVVVMSVATDSRGDAWINVRSAANDSVLAVYTPATGSFRYIRFSLSPYTVVPILTSITMDSYGTSWFCTQSDVGNNAPGLVTYNPVTGWDVVTKSDGLTDNQISAVAVDNDQNIWVGTVSGGIDIIYDPTNPHGHVLIYHPLSDQRIYSILVDPINNKWVATNNGVFVLSPDGTSIINQFTTESTGGKIPDNKITSLTLNRETGIVYIGTEKGLASVSTTAISPVHNFSSLTFFPIPFLLPSAKQLTIDGLVEGSSLKILSINGSLVRDLTTPGGRIGFWDGMDSKGNLVGSGIYLIVAYSPDGKQVATGKVAVVRK